MTVSTAIQSALPVISNLAILPAVFWAARRALVFESFVLLNVFLWSSIYHVCDSYSLCLLPFRTLWLWDHFFAAYSIIVLAIYASSIQSRHLRLLVLLGLGELLLTGLIWHRHSSNHIFILFGLAAALIALATWLFHGLPHYDWIDFGAGVLLGSSGLLIFALLNSNHSIYWVTHSAWHLAIMLSAYFFLEIRSFRRSLGILLRPQEALLENKPRIGAALEEVITHQQQNASIYEQIRAGHQRIYLARPPPRQEVTILPEKKTSSLQDPFRLPA